MKILIKKINGVEIPTRGNPDDAAYDITATSEPNIVGSKYERITDGINAWQKIDYIEYKTNLFIAPQEAAFGSETLPPLIQKFHTLLFPRSSVSKKNLILANSIGLIDNKYRGEILIRFKYVLQPEDLVILPEGGRQRIYAILNPDNVYQKGDKICQIKASPNIDIDFELVDSLDETKRGAGGFGSTN